VSRGGSKTKASRGCGLAVNPLKYFEKSFQKPLDKTAKVWYNIYVIKRANLSLINKNFLEKEGKPL
jgi:hypothetical protein